MATPRSWGWHRLEPHWAEALVDEAPFPRGALVVDIGAGTGALTAPLVAAGARVIAVEAHSRRAHQLRLRFGSLITVVQADAADLRLPTRPYYVVASPPYAITAPLLRRLLQPGSRLIGARLVLQDQPARRWASGDAPGARRWSQHFVLSLGRRVPREAFTPPPRVPSRVLAIDRRARSDSRERSSRQSLRARKA